MNINMLKEGMEVKNYGAMCELLGVRKLRGNSKKAQLKEWDRFFRYKKDGHKFIITEIYSSPLEKVDGRTNNGGANEVIKYVEDIELIILGTLAQEKRGGKIFLSKNGLLLELNMINGNYSFGKRNVPKLSKYLEIPIQDVHEFYQSSGQTMLSNINKALDRLKSKSLIYWTFSKTVCVANEDEYTEEIEIDIEDNTENCDSEQGIIRSTPSWVKCEYREATDAEARLITKIERDILNKMKIDSKQAVIREGKWDEFMSEVKSELLDKSNIVFYFDSYKIIYNDEHVSQEAESYQHMSLSDEEMKKVKKLLNINVSERILTNIERRHQRAIAESEEVLGIHKSEKIRRRARDNYIEDNKKLIQALLSDEAPSIRLEIDKIKLN